MKVRPAKDDVRLKRLVTVNNRLKLRWVVAGEISVRAYTQLRSQSSDRCVSTRSSELVFVVAGEHHVEFGPTRQQVCLSPGDCFLIHRGTPHVARSRQRTRLLVIDLLKPSVAELGVTLCRPCNPRISKLGVTLWNTSTKLGAAALVKMARRFVAGMTDFRTIALEPCHNTARMLHAKRALEERFLSPVNVAALAREMGLDRYYLLRAFKHNFGMTPVQYVQFLRLEHFLWTQLESSDGASLTSAALNAGFGDYSTFCRRIRRVVGRAPSRLVP
ncbi:MAG: hypothetical protein A2289_06225 [Deltaproteobacteria bacterium RIFOXYA12_FULL_58_15]|nr:MAG: hypothetical protein A2289_06225 [Deltaproteobacteria bacterium RIFOXYA12_FULL_58_15]OGR09868.1 MAG: hypothetical protein A2341_14295 [Deltaproteobacteria bacterium RIFOXYB12_FULL_58_9]